MSKIKPVSKEDVNKDVILMMNNLPNHEESLEVTLISYGEEDSIIELNNREFLTKTSNLTLK